MEVDYFIVIIRNSKKFRKRCRIHNILNLLGPSLVFSALCRAMKNPCKNLEQPYVPRTLLIFSPSTKRSLEHTTIDNSISCTRFTNMEFVITYKKNIQKFSNTCYRSFLQMYILYGIENFLKFEVIIHRKHYSNVFSQFQRFSVINFFDIYKHILNKY